MLIRNTFFVFKNAIQCEGIFYSILLKRFHF